MRSYVNSQGPTVTNIRVFPIRRSQNRVLIRLNVECDDKADFVLHENFWPRGVTCQPWMSRDALQRQHQQERESRRPTRSRDLPPRMRRNQGMNGTDDYTSANRFGPLQRDSCY